MFRISGFHVLLILGALAVGVGQASAEDISAKRILVKDNADTAKRQVQVQSVDLGVAYADTDDPATKGAWVHVYSATDDLCVVLPAGMEWQSKNSVWKYKNKTTKNQAQIGDGKLKVKIKSGITYTLSDNGSQGIVNAQVQFGDAGVRYCLRCGSASKDDGTAFSAKDCVVAACDAEPSYCGPPPPVPTGCGNGTIEAGEDCEADTDCAAGEACTDRCFCVDAKCPGSVEWTSNAGLATTSETDLGSTGLMHDIDPADDARLVVALKNFSGTPPSCGVGVVAGVNPRAGNCRCANDTRVTCNEPFTSDTDDCGGAVCNCYAAPPKPVSAGNTPLCLLPRLSADVTGTWNVDTGSAEVSVRQRTLVYLSPVNTAPCPTCVGDVVANDGIRGGTCSGGESNGLPCDAYSSDASFPAPGGGAYSYDCLPSSGINISGQGVSTTEVRTTGTASLPAPALTCDGGFDLCSCRVCSGDDSIGCSSDSECVSAGAGTCTGGGFFVEANGCVDSTCTPDGNGEGRCNAGPTDLYCDGLLRANGTGFLNCSTNVDCTPSEIGVDAGNCTITEQRRCFLDAITGTGSASTSAPTVVSAYCMSLASNPGINSVFGLPGPVKTRMEGATSFPCAGNPNVNYPACP